jgi:type I restriction enzyme S subunit
LVSSTAYENRFKIPVLTAGKTFILGYTNEEYGVFSDKLPVIIFDDFTTATKYVDFAFKAKSSAMKILLSKNNTDIKFVYESMQMLGYEVGVHERHWISIFSKIKIKIPKISEQQKIASCLSSLDELITAQTNKLETLKTYKKGLMQNLFPQEGEKVPKIRFKEFEKDGIWLYTEIENYIDLFSGIAFKSEEISDNQSGTPILRGINITEGYIRHSKDIDKFYTGDLENLKKYLIKENDIVIGMDGSKVGKNVALIRKEDENSILIQRVARIRTNKKTYFKYIYQHFISESFRNYVDRVNTSSGIPHISSQQIKNFKVGFPPKIEEQQKIAETLSSLDEIIMEQVNKIEELKLHKKGLMEGLFPKVKN